jgi:hypothetical protein
MESPVAGAVATAARSHDKGGPGGGAPTNVLLRAAYDLPLSDAQKSTLDALGEQLQSNEAETATPFSDVKADLVAGIKAGAIDAAKMTSDEAAVDKAMQVHTTKEAEVINGLHASLDPSQRRAVVDAVRARQAARAARPIGGGPMAADSSDPRSAQDGSKRRLDRMTNDLGLDAAQQRQAAAILAKGVDHPTHPGMKTQSDERQNRMDALLTAFQEDSFDAKTLARPMQGKTPHDFVHQQVVLVSQLLPILKADQREKLVMSMDQPWMGQRHGGDSDEVNDKDRH